MFGNRQKVKPFNWMSRVSHLNSYCYSGDYPLSLSHRVSALNCTAKVSDLLGISPNSRVINGTSYILGGGLDAVEIAGSNSTQAFQVSKKKNVFPLSLVNIQYCGELPWPRGSVLDLRPPRFEFRILCLEGSVISPSLGGFPGPV